MRLQRFVSYNSSGYAIKLRKMFFFSNIFLTFVAHTLPVHIEKSMRFYRQLNGISYIILYNTLEGMIPLLLFDVE